MERPQTLAEGYFGKVYKMKHKGNWAAMKKVPIEKITREQLKREMRVYEKARHKNVVRLLDEPWQEENKWWIPMEFIFGEDLHTTIFDRHESKIKLTSPVVVTIISGMCEGLLHLHSKDIVHQDLKPDNIMIEHGTHRAVIIDMGLAKFFVNGCTSAQDMGNVAYSAPEILHGHNARDTRSDVWAMGKIITDLFTRQMHEPTDVSSHQVRQTLKDNPYTDVVSRMVKSNARERATMAEVIDEIREIRKQQVSAVQSACACKHKCSKGVVAVNADTGRMHRPKQQDVLAVASTGAKVLAPMSVPFTLPPDIKMTQRRYENGEFVYKEVVTAKGEVVKYNNIKISPNTNT